MKKLITDVKDFQEQMFFSSIVKVFSYKKRGLRGYIYTLEVMFAIALVTGTMIFIFNIIPQTKQSNIVVLKTSAYNALEYLDATDEMRYLVAERKNTKELSKNLSAILPVNVDFKVEVCSLAEECDTKKVPTNRTVVGIDYYISGYRDKFVNKKVRLLVWEKY